MLTQPTLEKLRRMRLAGMAEGLLSQLKTLNASRSPSRDASGSWWTRNGPTAGTAAWPACSGKPSSGSPPVWKTSTTASPGAWSI